VGLPALQSTVPLPARPARHDRPGPAGCPHLHDAGVAFLERTGVRQDDAEAVERAAGSFPAADHTLAHDRERWYPSPIDRLGRSAWAARRGTTLVQRAAAPVDRIFAEHEPPPP
jgi:hypothetical protein